MKKYLYITCCILLFNPIYSQCDDLDYVNVSSLQLNGGTIDATLTLPEPGAAGSLGNNAAVIIRTISVTVTMNHEPIRPGYMNLDNYMDITVILHGSNDKALSDHMAFFSNTKAFKFSFFTTLDKN